MSDYNPLKAIRGATKAMNHRLREEGHVVQTGDSLATTTHTEAAPCCILLRSLTDGGPVPDDFNRLKLSGASLKEHVRPDGGVYLGAFEVQGQKDSLVIVYGPLRLKDKAERLSILERPALVARHRTAALGPFAQPMRPAHST